MVHRSNRTRRFFIGLSEIAAVASILMVTTLPGPVTAKTTSNNEQVSVAVLHLQSTHSYDYDGGQESQSFHDRTDWTFDGTFKSLLYLSQWRPGMDAPSCRNLYHLVQRFRTLPIMCQSSHPEGTVEQHKYSGWVRGVNLGF